MTIRERKRKSRRRARNGRFLLIAQIRQWWCEWTRFCRATLVDLRPDRDLLAAIESASTSQRILVGSAAVFGILLIWLIVSSYLVFQAADSADTALDLNAASLFARQTAPSPDQGSAARSSSNAPEITREQLRASAEQTIKRDPMNARALRVLGQLADAAGDEPRAQAFMQTAAHFSLHEGIALAWLIQKSYQRGDYVTVLRYADALLRNRPQLSPYVAPVLAQMAENKETRGKLNELLATNPPWRSGFLSELPKNISDPRLPLDLLLHLRKTPFPPTAQDFRSYIIFLVAHKYYDIAYYTWLQLLPPEELSKVGFLYNGSFESTPSGFPFDWTIASGSGVTADIATSDDGQRALFIQFGYGRVEFPGVSQLVMLGPGGYRFAGRYKSDIVARRGLTWRITCTSGAQIGQSAMVSGSVATWKEFEFFFTVPAGTCRAQDVRLVLDSRSASEQFISGSVWYDALQISRAETAALKPSTGE